MNLQDRAGSVQYDGHLLVHEQRGCQRQVVNAQDIAVVGEFTNEMGPFAPDYFYVFVTSGPGWVEIPWDAVGCEASLQSLAKDLGFELSIDLIFSTRLTSKVVWPDEIRGAPLFDFKPPPRRWFHILIPSMTLLSTLSSQVLEYLDKRNGGHRKGNITDY